MGLDIHFGTDKGDALYTDDYYLEENDYFNKHSLSRTFCNLINRRNVINGEPELDQIGTLTKTDVSPIYEMEEYPNEESLDFELLTAETTEEKERIIKDAELCREKLNGNIATALATVNNLIEKLSHVEDLPSLLAPTDFDTLDNQHYFSDFKHDKGEGYIGNNFGRDLRNFKRFLEFAKDHGATTVFFRYG